MANEEAENKAEQGQEATAEIKEREGEIEAGKEEEMSERFVDPDSHIDDLKKEMEDLGKRTDETQKMIDALEGTLGATGLQEVTDNTQADAEALEQQVDSLREQKEFHERVADGLNGMGEVMVKIPGSDVFKDSEGNPLITEEVFVDAAQKGVDVGKGMRKLSLRVLRECSPVREVRKIGEKISEQVAKEGKDMDKNQNSIAEKVKGKGIRLIEKLTPGLVEGGRDSVKKFREAIRRTINEGVLGPIGDKMKIFCDDIEKDPGKFEQALREVSEKANKDSTDQDKDNWIGRAIRGGKDKIVDKRSAGARIKDVVGDALKPKNSPQDTRRPMDEKPSTRKPMDEKPSTKKPGI